MKEINVEKYQRILNISNGLSHSQQRFIQSVIDSIRKRGGKASPKQYNILRRLETGDWNYSSTN